MEEGIVDDGGRAVFDVDSAAVLCARAVEPAIGDARASPNAVDSATAGRCVLTERYVAECRRRVHDVNGAANAERAGGAVRIAPRENQPVNDGVRTGAFGHRERPPRLLGINNSITGVIPFITRGLRPRETAVDGDCGRQCEQFGIAPRRDPHLVASVGGVNGRLDRPERRCPGKAILDGAVVVCPDAQHGSGRTGRKQEAADREGEAGR